MRIFKNTTYIIASLVITLWGFVFTGPALAQEHSSISVIFTPDPLFQEVNFLPGSSAYGSAQVSNNSGGKKPISVEAINITNDEVEGGQLFGDVLNLAITENSTELYSGTLTEFFDAGEIYLSNLEDSASATYDFTITFNGAAENKYQGKNLGFDVLIGFQGEEGGGTINGEGGGVRGLSIHNEFSKFITDTTATIIWFTSYKSTSRVIYCKESQNCIFDFSDTSGEPPLYGYKLTTIEQDNQIPISINGVTYHKIEIVGLMPGTTYYYRTVSHASPPTISREYSFTTLAAQSQLQKEENDLDDAINEAEVLDEELEPTLKTSKNALTDLANPDDNVKHESDITKTLDAPLVKGVSLDLQEENIDKTGDGSENDKIIKENDKKNIAEDAPQKITKSNIKEWLFGILLIIVIIELYFLIKNKKKGVKNEKP